MTALLSSCATGHGGGSNGALCSALVFVEPTDEEIDALGTQTREDILQNNLTLAEVCG